MCDGITTKPKPDAKADVDHILSPIQKIWEILSLFLEQGGDCFGSVSLFCPSVVPDFVTPWTAAHQASLSIPIKYNTPTPSQYLNKQKPPEAVP